MAGYDTFGSCIFTGFGYATAPNTSLALLNARYGWETGTDILQVLGRETLKIEHEFNRLAGLTPVTTACQNGCGVSRCRRQMRSSMSPMKTWTASTTGERPPWEVLEPM